LLKPVSFGTLARTIMRGDVLRVFHDGPLDDQGVSRLAVSGRPG
jgi:hypothetical protein